MLTSNVTCAGLLAFLSIISFTVDAQVEAQKSAVKASAPIEVTLVRSKVVLVDGKESLQDASTAKPGEVLQEVATYTNTSKASVSKLVAKLPIPANTEFVPGSVKPDGAKASIDGINFAAMPLKRKIKTANGVELEQLVPVSAYRELRWYPGDLAAGKSVVVSARYKVADDKPATAAKSPQPVIKK